MSSSTQKKLVCMSFLKEIISLCLIISDQTKPFTVNVIKRRRDSPQKVSLIKM